MSIFSDQITFGQHQEPSWTSFPHKTGCAFQREKNPSLDWRVKHRQGGEHTVPLTDIHRDKHMEKD